MKIKEKLNYISEEKMQEELQKRIDSYKEGHSRDGYILKAEGKFVYKGILNKKEFFFWEE